jgi:hypothetical protein
MKLLFDRILENLINVSKRTKIKRGCSFRNITFVKFDGSQVKTAFTPVSKPTNLRQKTQIPAIELGF